MAMRLGPALDSTRCNLQIVHLFFILFARVPKADITRFSSAYATSFSHYSPSVLFFSQIHPPNPDPRSTNSEPPAIVAAISLILALLKTNTPDTSVFNSLFAHPLSSIATNESNQSA